MKHVTAKVNGSNDFEIFVTDEEVQRIVRNIKRRVGYSDIVVEDVDEVEGDDETMMEVYDEVEQTTDDEIEHIEDSEGGDEIEYVWVVEEEETRDPFITFKELADMMGIRYQQVWKRSHEGKLISERRDGTWYVNLDSVEEWIAKRKG